MESIETDGGTALRRMDIGFNQPTPCVISNQSVPFAAFATVATELPCAAVPGKPSNASDNAKSGRCEISSNDFCNSALPICRTPDAPFNHNDPSPVAAIPV